MYKIAIDIMGGDNAPNQPIKGIKSFIKSKEYKMIPHLSFNRYLWECHLDFVQKSKSETQRVYHLDFVYTFEHFRIFNLIYHLISPN